MGFELILDIPISVRPRLPKEIIMAQDVKYVIVTPARDEEKHIAATIASVAGQTILPTEWIIVNDGSTDHTGSIIRRACGSVPLDPCHTPAQPGISKIGRWGRRSIL